MSLGSEVTEADVDTFLAKFQAAGELTSLLSAWRIRVLSCNPDCSREAVAYVVDTDKKVDQLQYIGLRFEHVDSVGIA
jgi:hypothetical protein